MSDSSNGIIRHLIDHQFTRLNRRRVYPCPRCGVIHIANRKKGDDYKQYVRDTDSPMTCSNASTMY